MAAARKKKKKKKKNEKVLTKAKAKPRSAKAKPSISKAKSASKAMPKSATVASVFRFANQDSMTFASVRKMSAVRQAQVLATLQMRNGSVFDTMDDAARALPSEFGATEKTFRLERYDILAEREKRPRFEMWIYEEEHGIVFELDGEATPVQCVQRGFWSTDPGDPAAVALAAALDEVDW